MNASSAVLHILRNPYSWSQSEQRQARLKAADLIEKQENKIAALRAENRRLRGAILWALGYSDFPDKPTGKGRYWWRTELVRRAAIGDDAAREAKP